MVCRSEFLLQVVPFEIIDWAVEHNMIAVIPPKKNRKEQRKYDKFIYKLRHLVENAFLKFKQWRGIATRYAKNSASFLAALHIRCFMLWANVLVYSRDDTL